MIKKFAFLLIIIMMIGQTVFAQEENDVPEEAQEENREILDTNIIVRPAGSGIQGLTIGIGPEFNMNSNENFAAGFIFCIDYKLPVPIIQLAAGLNFGFSSNFNGINVFEAAGLFRWYFLGIDFAGWFAQVDIGASMIFLREDLELEDPTDDYKLMTGLRVGFRLPLNSALYIEPYGRLGIPFAYGVGILAGVRY